MTRKDWKDKFRTSLWNKMNPGDARNETLPEGDQVFGDFVVRVNSKKHRNGDRAIIRIGSGTSTRKSVLLIKGMLSTDYHDPSAYAEEVAGYLKRKIAETRTNDHSV